MASCVASAIRPHVDPERPSPVKRGAAAWRLLAATALSSLALSAPAGAQLVLNPPGTVPAQCSVTGTAATCTGDLSAGLDVDGPPLSELTITNLTADIAPATGVTGLDADIAGGAFNLTIDGGTFGITTTGNGIDVTATAANSPIVITINSGSITTNGGEGIEVDTDGVDGSPVTIVNSEDHAANGVFDDLIDIDTDGTGSFISITNTGTLTGQRDVFEIDTDGINSPIMLSNTAPLTAIDDNTIEADTERDNSPITIVNSGALVSNETAIDLRSQGNDSGVTVTNQASVFVEENDGFEVGTLGDNSPIAIVNVGDVVSSDNSSFFRGFEIDTTGTNSALTIDHTGSISVAADGGTGIEGITTGTNSPVTIINRGPIALTGTTRSGTRLAAGIRADTDSAGSAIRIDNYGSITMSGLDAIGIAVNANPNETATVNLFAGTVQGGPGSGDGVNFEDVAGANFVLNLASGAVVTTLGDNAIEGGSGNETVSNAGTITGAVNLGAGTNVLDNLAGGVVNAAATVNLGAGNVFSNAGVLSPGGSGTLQTTALTGAYVQSASGSLAVDANFTAGTADLFTVTGTAALGGTVTPNVLNLVPGTQEFTILSATGGVTDNGLTVDGLASPAVVGALSFPNANDVVLGITVDFTPDSVNLNANQRAIADTLSAASSAGGGDLSGAVGGLLSGIDGVSAYTDALDQLSPEIFLSTDTAALFAAEDFTDNLFSCQARRGADTVVREGGCFWLRPEGRVLSVDNTGDTIGFDEAAVGLSGGAQVAIARDWLGGDWFAGFAAGYEAADLDTATGASSESDRLSVGASLKHLRGPWLMAAAIAGGVAEYDTVRPLSFGGFTGTSTSSHDVTFVAGQARVSYRWEQTGWYVNPLVDVNWTYLDRDDITESGGNGADLFIAGDDETFVSITPSVELGFDQALDDNTLLRPYLRAGVSVFTDDDQALTAEFVGAPAGVSAFTTTTEFDQVFADIEAGVVLFDGGGPRRPSGDPLGDLGDRAVVTLGYQGRIASDTSQHGGFLRVAIPF